MSVWPPDYLVIQWEDAILDMQELHNQRQKETFEKMKKFYEKAKDKPVSELIGDLLDNIKESIPKEEYEDNVVELAPKKDGDDSDTIH